MVKFILSYFFQPVCLYIKVYFLLIVELDLINTSLTTSVFKFDCFIYILNIFGVNCTILLLVFCLSHWLCDLSFLTSFMLIIILVIHFISFITFPNLFNNIILLVTQSKKEIHLKFLLCNIK